MHGTTVATNTMLQRNGAVVALVTSAGFRDVLEIGRTRRMLPSLYDTTFTRPPPLVPRPLRFEVAERLAADGAVLTPLDEAGLAGVADAIREAAPSRSPCAFCTRMSMRRTSCAPRAFAPRAPRRLDHHVGGSGARVPRVRTILDHRHQRVSAARHGPLHGGAERRARRARLSRQRFHHVLGRRDHGPRHRAQHPGAHDPVRAGRRRDRRDVDRARRPGSPISSRATWAARAPTFA